ncbi:hypothetical protein AP060_00968 [Pseudomonas sp. TAD18]|nr:hypothetical protein AP060_00968 [Pseudomonas sp. TAD18]KVV09585.1 hypothetical protein AP059_00898 [Pseudomonas sp. TAA207]
MASTLRVEVPPSIRVPVSLVACGTSSTMLILIVPVVVLPSASVAW